MDCVSIGPAFGLLMTTCGNGQLVAENKKPERLVPCAGMISRAGKVHRRHITRNGDSGQAGGGGTRVGIVTRTLTVRLRLLATYFLGHTYSYYSRAKQCLRYRWLRQAGTQLQNSCNQGEPFSRNGVNPARQKCLIRIQSRTNGWWRCCCWPWFCLWS